MKIEILYFSGCPNHTPAVECVREALKQEGTDAEVVETEVNDSIIAQNIGFLGSPTIRINGQDVEPSARGAGIFGMGCRTYVAEGKRCGVPPGEWIRAAVRAAKEI